MRPDPTRSILFFLTDQQRVDTLLNCTATILDWSGLDSSPAIDSRSLLPLLAGQQVPWDDHIVYEFHGHHSPLSQRIIHTLYRRLVERGDNVHH